MLKNKVALVTGAASGIGRATALAMAREGARVVVADIDTPAGEETASLVRDQGGEAIFVMTDVGKPEDCRHLVERAVAHYGRLDVACNNAGISGPQCLTADYPLEAWAQIININLSGVFYGMKYQIGAMLKTGGGSIINMSSVAGAIGSPKLCAYTATKHGIVGLTKATAIEYGTQGIRVNAIGPGFVETSMTRTMEDPAARAAMASAHPVGRIGRPEEVAELALWLASDRASFVTGAFYPVDGGFLAH